MIDDVVWLVTQPMIDYLKGGEIEVNISPRIKNGEVGLLFAKRQ